MNPEAEKTREEKLDEAFAEVPFVLPNNRTLRPFSRMSLSLCRAFALTMFLEPKAVKGDPEAGIPPMNAETFEDQLMTFAWMQSEPKEEVLRAKKNGDWKDKVELWSFDIEVGLLQPLIVEVLRISGIIAAASFEVEPKPESGEATNSPKS